MTAHGCLFSKSRVSDTLFTHVVHIHACPQNHPHSENKISFHLLPACARTQTIPEMTPKEIPWLGVLQRVRMRLGKELKSSWGILASRNRARKPLVFSVWVFKIAIFEEWSMVTMLLEKQSHGCEIESQEAKPPVQTWAGRSIPITFFFHKHW